MFWGFYLLWEIEISKLYECKAGYTIMTRGSLTLLTFLLSVIDGGTEGGRYSQT